MDLKEMRSKNYASLIADSDTIIMIINFSKRLDDPIVIQTEWVDPSGNDLEEYYPY